jgi:hypothetical protein
MRQLQLKKKESRIAWQILGRGIVALDASKKRASGTEQDEYKEVRSKLISAWKAGVIIGGVRPKHKIRDIMPSQILNETELVALKRETKQARAKAKRIIAVPHKRPSNGSE